MREQNSKVLIGCAGWTIPSEHKPLFTAEGSHLERYARTYNAVEINSSFYRPHRPATYQRWRDAVPDCFRFAVKVPKAITHEARLQDASGLREFYGQTSALGEKLGPWLVQLPPSLDFEPTIVQSFFSSLRDEFAGEVVCEPRHRSWFSDEADDLLSGFRVSRVAADPALNASAARPGGWAGFAYFRLHGSPRVYYSAYSAEYLDALALRIVSFQAESSAVWCIFDNTAAGAAITDAISLSKRINETRNE